MPLPEIEHSPHGYWIDLDRSIHPLAEPQSHARHPILDRFSGEGLARMQAGLDEGLVAVSIFDNSFSVRSRAGAVPAPVIASLARVVALHTPEAITTDHHGAGPTKTIMRGLRLTTTRTVPSFPDSEPQFASPWEEIAHLKLALSVVEGERDAYSAMASQSEAQTALKHFFKRFDDIRAQLDLVRRYYKKGEDISIDSSLDDKAKLDKLGFYIFHEMNRSLWYVGVLVKELFATKADD
jgi:hypothetical protein